MKNFNTKWSTVYSDFRQSLPKIEEELEEGDDEEHSESGEEPHAEEASRAEEEASEEDEEDAADGGQNEEYRYRCVLLLTEVNKTGVSGLLLQVLLLR